MNLVIVVLDVSALIMSIFAGLGKLPLWVAVLLLAIVQTVLALQGFHWG